LHDQILAAFNTRFFRIGINPREKAEVIETLFGRLDTYGIKNVSGSY